MAKLADVIEQTKPDKNWDEETLAQQRQIEEEIAKAQPLVGEKQSLAALEAEYNEKESAEFLRKAKELRQRYHSLRRVRGDGNCFYRAIAFAQLELLLRRDNPSWTADFDRFAALANGWKDKLLKLGYPAMTTEDFADVFADILKRLKEENAPHAKLLEIFNNPGESEYIVVFMRLVTGGYLLENEVDYYGFVEGERTMKQFVEQEISPMYRECDHLCIIALTKALNIPIRVEYMDRSQAPAGGWHHDFTLHDGQKPTISFLYRPGHYDILYPEETGTVS
jgi:ubiquitin thioesterase protein OTUB1